jgi:hypothetical protein
VIQKAKARGKDKVLKKEPTDLLLTDLNRDGLDDLMLLWADEVPVIFFNQGDGKFAFAMGADTPGMGILDKARPWTVCPTDADLDGKLELAACSGNLVRFIYFANDSEVPQAVRQYNSPEPDSVYEGCTLGDVTGNGVPELILYESVNRRIHVVDGEDNILMKLDVARFDFVGVEAVELNGDGKMDLLVKGKDRIGFYLSGRADRLLKEQGTYESKDKETYFLDVAAGDLNGSGKADAAVIDSGQKSLFIVKLGAEALKHVLKFKVFEQKLFQSKRGGAEPHGVKIRELTGDGKNDVLILVHDKIIIYPQQ